MKLDAPSTATKICAVPALPGQAVDHHWHPIAGIVDEQLVAGRMGLAHRHRQTALPGAVELTEARVPVSAGLGGDILLPQDRQRHVLAFELAVHGRPVGLGDAAVTLTVAIAGLREQPKFQNVSVTSSGNGQLKPAASNRRIASRTVEGAAPTRRAISRLGSPAAFILITSRTRRIASLSVGIQGPPSQSRKG